MDCTHGCIARKLRLMCACLARLGGTALLLTGLVANCRADSALQPGSAAGAGIGASAHLDIRVVVLPSLALSMQAAGWRAQGNSGALTLQRGTADAADASRLGASLQVSPRRRAIDTSMPVTTVAGGNLITVASP